MINIAEKEKSKKKKEKGQHKTKFNYVVLNQPGP